MAVSFINLFVKAMECEIMFFDQCKGGIRIHAAHSTKVICKPCFALDTFGILCK